MQYKEFGTENKNTILLLHGGGLSWWNYRAVAELLQKEYRVILPILDGHAGSDHPFSSIEDNADEIIGFIHDNLGGSVSLLGGLSFGAQIALEMLTRQKDLCRCALIESAMVIPSPLTNALIAPTFGSSYSLIRSRSFAKAQFRSLRLPSDLFEDYYRDTCLIAKDDMIAFMKSNTSYTLKERFDCGGTAVHIYAGEKEQRGILRSAEKLREQIPGCTVTILPGLYHGEFSIRFAADYADAVRHILRDARTRGEI